MKTQNLRALTYGINSTAYQRKLAQNELESLLNKMQELENLKEQYERRVSEVKSHVKDGSNREEGTLRRLITKQGCYRTIVTELEDILNL